MIEVKVSVNCSLKNIQVLLRLALYLLPGVSGKPGMFPLLGSARLAWKPIKLLSSLTSCVHVGQSYLSSNDVIATKISPSSNGIYLVREIGVFDNPLNKLIQGIPEVKAIVPVRNDGMRELGAMPSFELVNKNFHYNIYNL